MVVGVGVAAKDAFEDDLTVGDAPAPGNGSPGSTGVDGPVDGVTGLLAGGAIMGGVGVAGSMPVDVLSYATSCASGVAPVR